MTDSHISNLYPVHSGEIQKLLAEMRQYAEEAGNYGSAHAHSSASDLIDHIEELLDLAESRAYEAEKGLASAEEEIGYLNKECDRLKKNIGRVIKGNIKLNYKLRDAELELDFAKGKIYELEQTIDGKFSFIEDSKDGDL